METVVKKLYEAMFLVNSAEAASDWEGINKLIRTILEKAGAEVVSMKKWDERKLAYEIKQQSRGTYILCYFRADGRKISDIERDVRLSERVMRVLILNAEHLTQQDIEGQAPAVEAVEEEPQAVRSAAESEEQMPELKEPDGPAKEAVAEDKAEPEEQF